MPFNSAKMMDIKGKIHHLGADEHDIAERMILTCGVEEVPIIAGFLDDAKQTADHREYLTYKGTYKGKEVGVMSCGHGCMPMAIAVEELNHCGCKKMIKVGDGQAIMPGLKPGTIVIPSGSVRSEGATLEYLPKEYPAVANLGLVKILVKQAKAMNFESQVGIVRTHDGFYVEQPTDPEGKERIDRWAKIGVLMNEHELSPLFVLSEIFRLKAAGILLVSENLQSGSSLSKEEIDQKMMDVYRMALEAIIEE